MGHVRLIVWWSLKRKKNKNTKKKNKKEKVRELSLTCFTSKMEDSPWLDCQLFLSIQGIPGLISSFISGHPLNIFI